MDCIHPKPGAPDFETAEQLYIDPERLHRLRRLRRGLPGRRDLPRLRAAREVRLRARAQRASSSPSSAPPSARRRDGRRAPARGDRRRRARRRVRRRVPAARARRRRDRPASSGCPRRGACCAAASRPTTRRSSASRTPSTARRCARGCRFLGNVEVGVDVSHAELMEHYTAVVYATGAQTDKSLGHPRRGPARQLGRPPSSSPGTTATPTTASSSSTSPRERAVVIGNGNVAADVIAHPHARAPTSSRAPTSPTTRSRRCARAAIEEVVVLGRRGPAQAAFTSAELRELGRLDGVDLRVDPDDVELDPVSRAVAGRGGHLHRAQERRAAARVRRREPARRTPRGGSTLRFLRSPVEIRGDGRVEAVDVRRNEIVRERRRRAARAAAPATQVETIECGLVLRSVGYRAVPLPDVPFDERRFVLPNERGRVLTPDGEPLPGVYAVGWIKRGPTGILGTNKRDAERDRRAASSRTCGAGALAEPARPGASDRRAARRARAGPRHRRRLARDRRPASSSAAAPRAARGSSSRRATSCSTPRRPSAPDAGDEDSSRWTRRGHPRRLAPDAPAWPAASRTTRPRLLRCRAVRGAA